MTRILTALIRLYQWMISPLFGNCCRFHPSCSNYAIEALQTHGFFKGTGLTIIRICKCQPFHPGGFDPVPPRKLDKHNETKRGFQLWIRKAFHLL